MQAYVWQVLPMRVETRQAGRVLIYEERTELLWHQIGSLCRMCCVNTQGTKIGVFLVEVIDNEAEGSELLKLGNWSAIFDREAVDDTRVRNIDFSRK